MDDLSPGFIMPTDAEWQRWGERSQDAVHKLIAKLALQAAVPGNGIAQLEVLPAIGFGALVAAGDFLRVITGSGPQHITEQWALATLRGALRGAEGPVTDAGKPFVRTADG